MSQEALAGLVGRSRSWLSQVERGIHGVDRLSTLTDLATVLRCDVSDLLGDGRWRLAPNGGARVRAIDSIRTQLFSYSHLLVDQPKPWPLPQLRNAAVEVHRAYQAARYDAAAGMLPAVLAAADAYDGFNGRGNRETHLARCNVYAVSAKLLTKVGEAQLAWIAADRATHAALAADSPAGQGMATYQVACALLRSGRNEDAEHIAVRSAESLMSRARSDEPDLVSLAGSLWLLAAIIAGRRADRSEAMRRLATADELAGLLAPEFRS
jgi:transcriptional regulator with XRE-family HTH domain